MQKVFGWVSASILGLLVLSATAVAQTTGEVLEIRVAAPALDGNLLGTPDIQSAAVYLPPGYEEAAGRHYPVVYLLHGIFDEHRVWIDHHGLPGILDRLIMQDRIPPVIAVMPDGGNRYGGGYYRNSATSGNWADFVTRDLVAAIDARFRTLPTPGSRAVVGHSMGGYGALHLVMEHPGVFSVAWALSPCCLAPVEDLGFGNDAWRRASGVTRPGDIQTLIDRRDFYPVAMLGIVTAFSPDPENGPVYATFPFEIRHGEVNLDPNRFEAYADAFPINQVRGARSQLRALRGLGMDVGLGDQFLHIPTGTLALSQRLAEERIPHRLDVYAGDHREHIPERLEGTVLPWVIERLEISE